MPFPYQFANCSSPLSLSDGCILPLDKRPILSDVCQLSRIPIIDLQSDQHPDGDLRLSIIDQMLRACQEYGFFHIVNHGLSKQLLQKMEEISTDFFGLPAEERARFYTEDKTAPVKISNPFLKSDKGKVRLWNENLYLRCTPLEDYIHLLPENPTGFREIVAEYAKEMGELVRRLLGLLSQGLGLDPNYLQGRLGEHMQNMQINYYPACPDPELTMGLPVHTDLGVITVLRQTDGVSGLQVIKDGKWMAVDPMPNSLIVNVADQLQVMSNGRLKSVHHRAVNNQLSHRVSIATFYRPAWDAVIGPADELVDEQHPRMYRNYRFEEFFKEFCRQEGARRMVKEVFELHS